jgi:hypothetical protein
MVMSTAESLIGVLVPISRLKRTAELFGFRAALSYARWPTYLLPLRSIKIADGVLDKLIMKFLNIAVVVPIAF